MNTTSQRALVMALVAALLVLTRLHLPTTFGHLGPLPDASWAAFFIGGYYLRGWSRWAFPLFMAAAVAVDGQRRCGGPPRRVAGGDPSSPVAVVGTRRVGRVE